VIGLRVLRVFVVIATVIFVSFCGVSRRTANEVTLRFWGFGREGEVIQELIPEFERRNPGIRVQVQQIPWTAAHEKLLTAFVGEATPDLAQLGNTWVPEFAALGALEPLTDWEERSSIIDSSHYFSGIWDTNLIRDTLFGIPWYVDTRVLFYRKDLLARAGYREIPDTWDQWRAAMLTVKRQLGPDRYAIFLPTNEWAQPAILGLRALLDQITADGDENSDDRQSGQDGRDIGRCAVQQVVPERINCDDQEERINGA
jgi:multiple sugar transport system substrate-binding protein